MKITFMLTVLLVLACGTFGFAQAEPPLEPIPLPAPVGKADTVRTNNAVEVIDHQQIEAPLDGPIFPDGSVIVEQGTPAPTQMEMPPAPTIQPGDPAAYEIAPSSIDQPPRGRVDQQARYQQTNPYPGAAGVVVYRIAPYSRVTRYEVTRMAPAIYTVDVPVPARLVGPYPVHRAGAMRAFGPPSPIVPLPYQLRPVPYMPGQPVRNAIRSALW